MSPNSLLHADVQQYCDIMINQYKQQRVVSTDWPPPVGQDIFGRLALLQAQDKHVTPQTILQKQWCMLRGQVDKIPQVTQDKQIDIQDVLKPCDSGQSLRVVVDGPPGIGKTTLCRKLLNMWAKGELTHGQYNLVLYCPLRNDKVAQASTLADLSVYQSPTVSSIVEWMISTEGEGLLIIFDGWDELSKCLRQCSLATRIICREMLAKCSVIVTSRSYASSSLLEISSVNRHVEVLGFSAKEIEVVIKGTLEKQSHLATKLIKDLEVRGDVQSLCYVPLVCSIIILVYCKLNGQLPTTLTELFENFILQTIRRHVKIKSDNNIEPRQLHSLHMLPPVLSRPFKEICQFAYYCLRENKMSFSSIQVDPPFDQSVRENYLGLITTFTVYDEERYQFLHLSIQEFLAAWWIAKYEKTEEVFAEHFNNDHFRMCLRFIAGLTHLEHESYQQYFNKELDLQCKRRPLFGFEKYYYSHFRQYSENVRPHIHSLHSNEFDVLLFQLLHESQNTKLCEILSEAIKDHSLCLYRVRISLFDNLCLNYFLNNSKTTWSCLDLRDVNGQEVELLTNVLMNSDNVQCIRLEIEEAINQKTAKLLIKLFQSSFSHNLQECYITLTSTLDSDLVDVTLVLLNLIKLQRLKILHFKTSYWGSLRPEEDYIRIDKMIVSELEECLHINSTLQELVLVIVSDVWNVPSFSTDIADIVNRTIKGVTRNKSIITFSFTWIDGSLHKKRDRNEQTFECSLRDNHTLQALKLNLPNHLILSVDHLEVNTTLAALEIRKFHELTSLLCSQHIKGLHCLILHQPYHLPLLFQCYPNLQQLQLSLDTAESVIELFSFLRSNTMLKALRVEIKDNHIINSMGPTLRDMLIVNRTVKYLEIDYKNTTDISSSYLSFLTTGLSQNTSLQELSVPIPLSGVNNDQITTFFNVISHKNNLTEFKVDFKLDQSCVSSDCSDHQRDQKLTTSFYEQGLPIITTMLQSHTTMKLLNIHCESIDNALSQPNWIELAQHFWQAVVLHPTLQYIGIKSRISISVLMDILKSQEKTLIDINKQQLLKRLPIIDL